MLRRIEGKKRRDEVRFLEISENSSYQISNLCLLSNLLSGHKQAHTPETHAQKNQRHQDQDARRQKLREQALCWLAGKFWNVYQVRGSN